MYSSKTIACLMNMLAIATALPVTTSTTATIPVNEKNIDCNPHPYKPHPHSKPLPPSGPLSYPPIERDPQVSHSYSGKDEPTKQVGIFTCDEPGCSELGEEHEVEEVGRWVKPIYSCLDPGCDSAKRDGEQHEVDEVGRWVKPF